MLHIYIYIGARCSSVVIAFAHGAMGATWCNKGHGMCYLVCGMVHIKRTLLLISDFLSRYLNGSLPYARRHITVNKMC